MKKTETPSFLRMVRNFVKDSAKFIAEGAPVCSKEEYEERMAICVSCEHFTEKKTCGLCGCNMPLKVGWKTSECADTPKKWNKLITDEEEKVLIEKNEKDNAENTKEQKAKLEIHSQLINNAKKRGKR